MAGREIVAVGYELGKGELWNRFVLGLDKSKRTLKAQGIG